MTFGERLAQDRRLVILRSLTEVPGSTLNEVALKDGLAFIGHQVGRDVVRGDVAWLEEQLLVRVEKIAVVSGELWVVRLTVSGEEVAEGRHHPGVKKRGAS